MYYLLGKRAFCRVWHQLYVVTYSFWHGDGQREILAQVNKKFHIPSLIGHNAVYFFVLQVLDGIAVLAMHECILLTT